jgi:hypothetical protein
LESRMLNKTLQKRYNCPYSIIGQWFSFWPTDLSHEKHGSNNQILINKAYCTGFMYLVLESGDFDHSTELNAYTTMWVRALDWQNKPFKEATSTKQKPFWGCNSLPVGKEILCILWNLKFHYHVNKTCHWIPSWISFILFTLTQD